MFVALVTVCWSIAVVLSAAGTTPPDAGSHSSPAAKGLEDYQPLVFKTNDGEALPYRLLKPRDYDPAKRYPLVLFLHGAGERGTDNEAQLKHVVRIFTRPENREKYPCFVVVPQCPPKEVWSTLNLSTLHHPLPPQPTKPMALTFKLLERLCEEFSIDRSRLYIMGLSMGGFGTWDAIARRPDFFAAAVPMCGGGDEQLASRLVKLPIWCFHGAKDPIVKVENSRRMIEAIRRSGGNPKYTEYPEAGHDCWTPASREPELIPWLFSQRRESQAP